MATVRQCVRLNCFHIHVSLSRRLHATGNHRLTSKLHFRDATEDYWSPRRHEHTHTHTQSQCYPASPAALLAYAIHMAGIARNTTLANVWSEFKEGKVQCGSRVIPSLILQKNFKLLLLFAQSAPCIATIVSAPCLGIAHHSFTWGNNLDG